MEEWQDPDSGYLNCIGVGDTYVKKQIARILSQNKFTADHVSWFLHGNNIEIWTDNFKFKEKTMSKEPLNEARREFEKACDEHIARHGRNVRVYISGPMTGLERREYLRNFYQAEERLRQAGFHKIVNPARLAPCRWPWLYRLIGYWWTIRYDLFWLRRCDMIYKLDGWQTSRGALIESAKAEKWNIKTLELCNLHPIDIAAKNASFDILGYLRKKAEKCHLTD